MSSTKKTWENARKDCRNKNGDLISIKDKAEDSMLRRFLDQKASKSWRYWIGLNDKLKEGSYVWSDGSSFNYAN